MVENFEIINNCSYYDYKASRLLCFALSIINDTKDQ